MKKKQETQEALEALRPDYCHRNEMAAFFGADSDVTVTYDEKGKSYNIVVGGCEYKAEMLRTLLKGSFVGADRKKYTLLVNGKKKTYRTKVNATVIRAAFAGNKLFKELWIKYNSSRHIEKWALLVKAEAVQFPNDNAGSPFGFETHSAEDVARAALHDKLECVLFISSESSVGDNGYWSFKK